MATAIRMIARAGLLAMAVAATGWSCKKAPPAGGDGAAAPISMPSSSAVPMAAAPSEATRRRVDPIGNDPALAPAKARLDAGDVEGFATLVLATQLPPERAARAAYLAGMWLSSSGKPELAAAAFDRAAQGPLLEPASYHAALELVKSARLPEAAERAGRVQSARPYLGESRLVVADAAMAAGNRDEAKRLYRLHVQSLGNASRSRPTRWADVSVRLAKMIADSEPKEARQLLRRVVVEAPVFARTSGGFELHATLVKKAGLDEKLSSAERLERAQALVSANDATARGEMAALVADAAADKNVRCRAASEVAKLARKKSRADGADAWGAALRQCEGVAEERPGVLYNGAKAQVEAKRDAEAQQWFQKLETEYPSHRLADDARFRRALVEKEAGDNAAFVRDMSSLPDAFPKGDMGPEALFRVALASLEAGDYAAALPVLAKIDTITPAGFRHWASAGRAKYFRARCTEVAGNKDDAKTLYGDVLRDYPLTYYGLLAWQRLEAVDSKLASLVVSAKSKEDATRAPLPVPAGVIGNDAYQRAKLLFESGDLELAHREIQSSNLIDKSASPEDVWEVAGLYVDGGDARHGHGFTRERITEYMAHYPAGGYRDMWEIAYPRAFRDIVEERAARYKVRQSVIWGVMREESTFDVGAKSWVGALGLMQLMPDTAKWMAKDTNVTPNEATLRTAAGSVELGSKLLARLFGTQGRYPFVLAGYNAGEGASKRFRDRFRGQPLDILVELVPFDETRGYIKRVTQSTYAFAALYEPAALEWLQRDALTTPDVGTSLPARTPEVSPKASAGPLTDPPPADDSQQVE